ncbi:hypothetical protein ACVIRM_002615 [Rhizobium laguerreae]
MITLAVTSITPLLGEFCKREGDIAFRPTGFDGLVRQSLERAGEALPAS